MKLERRYSSQARRFLKKLHPVISQRISGRITALLSESFPQGVIRVENNERKLFRIRVGDFRITYSVLYEQQLLFIVSINKRENAYD